MESKNQFIPGLVSIICPYRNTERYIQETLTSILNQSYSNWELIIVNDHSQDGSEQIVQEFSNNDSRIVSLKNIGEGIIDALKTGYALSKGEFITRMDSDDLMTENKLEVMTNQLLEKGKGNIALGKVHYFSESGIGEGFRKYEHWLNGLTQNGNNYSEIYKECVIPSPCWMVYKSDFDEVGGFSELEYPEDYDLAFKFFKNDLKPIPTSEVLHHWRDYSTRTSRTHDHYADNSFLVIKEKYFLEIHRNEDRPLVLWGAGRKGKTLAKSFLEKGIDFTWICDNPKKIGKSIYGKEMLKFEVLEDFSQPQNLITVANEKAKEEIETYLKKLGKVSMEDYFFFC